LDDEDSEVNFILGLFLAGSQLGIRRLREDRVDVDIRHDI
jgi:hypothetical protein